MSEPGRTGNRSGGAREALRLAPEELRRRCEPDQLPFATTAEVEPLDAAIGQARALRAIEFALGMEGSGYNLFATGPFGSGKQRTLQARLAEAAAARPTPGDVVYLHNFDAPERPLCAIVPAGRAQPLAQALVSFVADARARIPAAFDSDSYRRRHSEAVGPLEHEREATLDEVKAFAHAHGVELELTPSGIVTLPLVDGKPVTRQQFELLPQAMQSSFLAARGEVLEQMASVMHRIREIDARAQQRIGELNREVVLFAVGHLIDELKRAFGDVPQVGGWLDRVREDVIDNYERFVSRPEMQPPMGLPALAGRDPLASHYAVNVFLSHQDHAGAPLIVERSPTFQSLFGRIEYETTFGAAVTDHRHIKAGAIHRAHGGFLLLHAGELLSRPFLWDKLKQILLSGLAPVENLADQYVLLPSATLAPEPMAVDVKVVLVGTPAMYELLYELDEDVRDLFGVKADFDVEMPWTQDGESQYAAFIAAQARARDVRHFDREAVAATIEQGARRAAHRERLSTRLGELADLAAQASHWAGREGAEVVGARHVHQAIEEHRRRSDLIEQKLGEAISQDTLHVDLSGTRTGQVNGLAVSQSGDYAFCHPLRVTASAGPGQGRVVSIERETKLSGQAHDKAFLTVRGFLQQRYGGRAPLSLGASLAFEQSYGTIDGDSAASAELCALLSSLAQAPVDQQLAITGSLDQHGRIQPVGAVSEKIEGFFRACERAGLTGEQGVIVPAANVRHLMVGEDVVEAVRAGRFHVWAIDTVDQAIELLTGLAAGERGPAGSYPEGTFHRRVEESLAQMTDAIRALAGGQAQAGEGEGEGED